MSLENKDDARPVRIKYCNDGKRSAHIPKSPLRAKDRAVESRADEILGCGSVLCRRGRAEDAIENYSITGGVAFYLVELDRKSAIDNILENAARTAYVGIIGKRIEGKDELREKGFVVMDLDDF